MTTDYKNEAPPQGFHEGVEFTDYTAWRAMNNSTLGRFEVSALEARHCMLNGSDDTDGLRLGHFAHTMILEPQNIESKYARSPKFDRRTNAGKEADAAFRKANPGKCSILDDEWELAESLAKAVAAHPLAKRLMQSPGASELSATWADPVYGIPCKSRMDRLTTRGTVVDLKTTKDKPTRYNVGKIVAEYGYHRQAAWYLDGANIVAPENRRFVFVFVQKSEPFDVVCYELSAESIEQGRRENRRYLDLYMECMKTGHWPGISDRLELATLPAWRVERDFSLEKQ